MRRLRLVLLSVCLSCLILLPNQPAGALDKAIRLETKELEKIFFDLATARTSLPKKDIVISKFIATPEAIELPPGPLDFRIISGSQAKPLGHQVLVTEVLVNGDVQCRIKLSGDLTLYGDVVCTASALPRHSIVAAHDLKRVRRNLAMLGPDLITDEASAIGKEIKTTLQPGAILYGNALKEPEIVKRGDIVSIMAASDFITVTVPGRAQSAGAKGDLIKVKNLMSRKEIFVRIIGPNTVQAQF